MKRLKMEISIKRNVRKKKYWSNSLASELRWNPSAEAIDTAGYGKGRRFSFVFFQSANTASGRQSVGSAISFISADAMICARR